MATSSIFHNVRITRQNEIDSLINAMEASIADPHKSPESPPLELVRDKTEIQKLQALRRGKKRGTQ